MHCPTLTELPSPPEEKTGWPWTEESDQLPDTMPDGSPWPRISIVTPSYNQGEFIEETIRSVLLQGYPDLEYIIIDGGSTDESVEIIEKYSLWLKHWVSETDKGQAHAINKGFEKSNGSIDAYINSDDYYIKGVFDYVAITFGRENWDFFIGRQSITCGFSITQITRRSFYKTNMPFLPYPFLPGTDKRYEVSQESTFWASRLFEEYRFDNELNFCLDVDWFCKISFNRKIFLTSKIIGHFRIHESSKTANLQEVCDKEHHLLQDRYKFLENINQSNVNRVLFKRLFINLQAPVLFILRKQSSMSYICLVDRSKTCL